MRRGLSLGLTFVAASIATMAILPVAAIGASSIVECGQLTGYLAPDPLAPADGSLQLGALDPWVVLATATVSPAAATALPALAGSGPTCVALDLDDFGAVTAIDFAPTGHISGHVAFDAGPGFYLFADRLIVPTFITDAYPGLAALVVTSDQAGTVLDMTFTVDTTTGQFTGFDGQAAFCGLGSMTAGGDGRVGDAVLPAAVLDGTDRSRLDNAGNRTACAAVHSTGTIDLGSGNLSITTSVDIDVAAGTVVLTPPPTSTVIADRPGTPPELSSVVVLLVGACIALVAATMGMRPRLRD
jgi:hypothetical protein